MYSPLNANMDTVAKHITANTSHAAPTMSCSGHVVRGPSMIGTIISPIACARFETYMVAYE